MTTIAHITHEAVEKIGGIGTVLEGLLTCPLYQQRISRSILVGPYATHLAADPAQRLGPDGQVLYSTIDRVDRLKLGGRLRPIEWAFNVTFVYGRRAFIEPDGSRRGEAEVLLIDVFNANPARLGQFKHRLWEVFGIDSTRYEGDWGYEEYVRLSEPAFYALLALHRPEELPCVIFSHEFMGLPTAFKAVLDGQAQFRTIFHAHECGTARRIVEDHPGHDSMFYNVLRLARERRQTVADVFGDQSHHFRHALISRAHVCDGIIAVSRLTAQEMHFLDRHFDHHQIDLVHNGIPAWTVTPQARERSRRMLGDYAQALLGRRPDVLMTHVTRPVISKAVWRDAMLCHELDALLAREGRSGILFILTSAAGVRRPQDVRTMEDEYAWPRHHRAGYPDLVGPEIDLDSLAVEFNRSHQQVQIVLVNQFGWDRARLGDRLPEAMTFADLRRGTDVELGMACYEPFGISPLEPLGSGAVCVVSTACGCAEFAMEATRGREPDNVLVADFARLPRPMEVDELLRLGREERQAIEGDVCRETAVELARRLPRDEGGRARLLAAGQALLGELDWDHVLREHLIPLVQRVVQASTGPARERKPAAESDPAGAVVPA